MMFKQWLRLDEMPHVSVRGNLSIPCPILVASGMQLPCLPNQKIGGIDPRFEMYPKGGFPWNKLMLLDAKWIALIPGSTEYLAYDGTSRLMQSSQARKEGLLPLDERPGEMSEQGYVLLPNNWLKYALVYDTDHNFIKQ